MQKLVKLLGLLILLAGIQACSNAPVKYGNSAEQQRQHAREAQDELSKDTNR